MQQHLRSEEVLPFPYSSSVYLTLLVPLRPSLPSLPFANNITAGWSVSERERVEQNFEVFKPAQDQEEARRAANGN